MPESISLLSSLYSLDLRENELKILLKSEVLAKYLLSIRTLILEGNPLNTTLEFKEFENARNILWELEAYIKEANVYLMGKSYSDLKQFFDKYSSSNDLSDPIDGGISLKLFFFNFNTVKELRDPIEEGIKVKLFFSKFNSSSAFRFPIESGNDSIINRIKTKFIEKYGKIIEDDSWAGRRSIFNDFEKEVDNIIF